MTDAAPAPVRAIGRPKGIPNQVAPPPPAPAYAPADMTHQPSQEHGELPMRPAP
jgi:hypothetical protein